MKKILFTFLLVIPFCKAAEVSKDSSWFNATQTIEGHDLNPMLMETLNLYNTRIESIPRNIQSSKLRWLYLNENNIHSIEPHQLLKQFPKLEELDLSENPISQDDVNNLITKAKETHPNLKIIANHLHRYISDDGSWNAAIKKTIRPGDRDIHYKSKLCLNNQGITSIPRDVKLPNLQELFLKGNEIHSIEPRQILKQFPKLKKLNLDKNPIDPNHVDELSAAAAKQNRSNLEIIAPDFSGLNIKQAKR